MLSSAFARLSATIRRVLGRKRATGVAALQTMPTFAIATQLRYNFLTGRCLNWAGSLAKTVVGISDIDSLCREKGLRLTGQRRTILDILMRATDHPDAIELHRRAARTNPRISLSTVYRTLNALEYKGVLQKHHFSNGPARFEAVDRDHHDHLIDISSGKVIEFRSEEIERLQRGIAHEHGFEIISHRLEIYVKPTRRKRAVKRAGNMKS